MYSNNGIGGFRLRGLVGGEERVFDLDTGRHLVGRAPESDVQLPAVGVSRRHAVLRVGGGELTVEDQGSTNGTFLGDRRLKARTQARPGAVLGFGPVALRVQPLHDNESRLAFELARRPETSSTGDSLEPTDHLQFGEPASSGTTRAVSGLTFPAGYRTARSTAMTTLYRQIQAVVKGPIPVLLIGETGVGKEVIARILHLSSPRREAPFLAVNCSAIPADLLEAELFGIEKAVATGVDPRPGLFLSAAGGTLLLDEIGEMPQALQAKLLRVLQDKEVRPLGGTTSRRIEVHIVSATNADLRQLMDAGRFREDLYFRLAGDILEVPSLRRCRDDIQPLARHFLEGFSREIDVRPRGLSLEAARLLRSYSWPGNVRELENEIRRIVYHASEGQIIDSSLLSARIRSCVAAAGTGTGVRIEPGALALAVRVRQFEAEVISEALRHCGGNQTRAAAVLEISRNGLLKKMKRLGIDGSSDH